MTLAEIDKDITIADFIGKTIGTPALCEGLAEEMTEAAHAALKLARILRGENPTPVAYVGACQNLTEEIIDILIYVKMLHIDDFPYDIVATKVKRLYDRVQKGEAE